jgi:hypothetical protein
MLKRSKERLRKAKLVRVVEKFRDERKKAAPDTVSVTQVLQLIARGDWGQLRIIAAIHLFEDRAQFTGPVISTLMVLQQLNRLQAPVIAPSTILHCFSNSKMPSDGPRLLPVTA